MNEGNLDLFDIDEIVEYLIDEGYHVSKNRAVLSDISLEYIVEYIEDMGYSVLEHNELGSYFANGDELKNHLIRALGLRNYATRDEIIKEIQERL